MIRCYIVNNKIVKVVNKDYAKREDEHNATLQGLGIDVEYKDADFSITDKVTLDEAGNVVLDTTTDETTE